MPKKREKMEAWLAPKWEPIKHGKKIFGWLSDKGHCIDLHPDFLGKRLHTKSAKLFEVEGEDPRLEIEMEMLPEKGSATVSPGGTEVDTELINIIQIMKGDTRYDIPGINYMHGMVGDTPIYTRRMLYVPEDVAAEYLAKEIGSHWEKGERLGHIVANKTRDVPDDSLFRKAVGLKPGEWMSFLGKVEAGTMKKISLGGLGGSFMSIPFLMHKEISDLKKGLKEKGDVVVKDSLVFQVNNIPPEEEVNNILDELARDIESHEDPFVKKAVKQLIEHYKKRGQKPLEDDEKWMEAAVQPVEYHGKKPPEDEEE